MGRFRGRPRTGRLIVRLKPSAAAELVTHLATTGSYPATLHDVVSVIGPNADPLQTLLGHSGIGFRPAVPPQFAEVVRQNELAQQNSNLAPLRSLLSYFLVSPNNAPLPTSSLATELAAVPIVEFVQPEPAVTEAAGTWVVNPNDYNSIDGTTFHGLHTEAYRVALGGRKYYGLNCACDAVWGKYGGAGVGFIDLEAAWHLGHADLNAASLAPQPIWNFNCVLDDGARSHGTRSLGVVVGADNERGVVGIAPRATFYGVVSRAEIDTDNVLAVPDQCADITGAIVAAVQKMKRGDVLLTEVQTVAGTNTAQGLLFNFAPIEIVDLWFDALRYAGGYGVTVIEPAGNGDFNLDTPGWIWNMGGRSLDRDGGGAAFQDSGAVMVSGCSPMVNNDVERLHEAEAGVNYGSRIDCYGWMTQIGSTDVTTDGNDTYDDAYGGTSAASAMIAGAAILVQEMYRSSHGTSGSPTQVRQLLTAHGSPVKGTGRVVPDLELVAQAVGALPDVFVRDSVADDGTVPSSLVSMSPDIIIRKGLIPDPDAAFGNGSGLEETFLDNDDIIPDAVNYVYVRVRNRNTIAADAVRATVYWADTMVAVPPTEWSEIGTTSEAPVAAAPAPGVPGPLTILGPLEWWPISGASPPQYPSSHGCLVAVVDAVGDPRPAIFPSLGDLVTSWTNFTDIVGANNNLAYRNFNVISLTPTPTAGVSGAAEVIIPGAPRAEVFDILIRVPVCEGVEWELLVPRQIARHFGADRELRAEGIPDEYAVVRLKSGSSLRARNVPVQARQRHRCIVRVRAPRVPDKRCWIFLAQRLRDIELGRVTFSVGPRPRREPKRDDDGDRRRSR